ncbi:MAG: sodium:proton antiporter [Frankiales bacterium]|jgi:multicomponent Na+:H+ antiporter subunit F|nr:sodium:proton antiporter [Frankiales bacterium]
MSTGVVLACFLGLSVAALLVLVRLARGPSVPDRIVALDVLVQIVVAGIAVAAAVTRDGTYLAVLVAVSLLGFVGTVTVGRFVERRGS